MGNKLIFTPAFSVGSAKDLAKTNFRINNNTTFRFYDRKCTTEKMYHPYFLVTAGHCYKESNFRKDLGLENAFVIGDSGGYQISTGAIKWDKEMLKKIFNFLENNSTIALNIDFPTRNTFANDFNFALNQSVENFKYFNDHQTGKTKFLNVLQGAGLSFGHAKEWYNQVKDFEFNGWALGGVRTVDKMMRSIAFFLDNKEFEKDNVKYLHFLGVSGVDHFITLSMLQKEFNKKFGGNKIQVTCDSSTPGLASVYGFYYSGIDWKNSNFQCLIFGKKHTMNELAQLPCFIDCEVCKGKTYADIIKFDKMYYAILILHNLNLFVDTVRKIDLILESHDDVITSFFPNNINNLRKSMNEMFESTHPIDVYNKYNMLYKTFSNNIIAPIHDKSLVAEFFQEH